VSLTEVGDDVEGVMAAAISGFGYTMGPITGFMGPAFGFVEFLQTELGADGPQVAVTLLQGFENVNGAGRRGCPSGGRR
jgi:hypothetical protein